MKFGIYAHPSTNLDIRCIDGHFDLIRHPAHLANATPAAFWEYYSTAPGFPCDQAVIRSKLESCGSLCTYRRSIARVLYGVPDNVELYKPGDFGVKL